MVYGRNLTHRDLIVSGLNLLQTILSKRFTLLEIHYFQPSNLLLCIFLNCKVIPHNNTLQYSPYFNIIHLQLQNNNHPLIVCPKRRNYVTKQEQTCLGPHGW